MSWSCGSRRIEVNAWMAGRPIKMFRIIAKWLIGRAIERDAPLPRWAQRWVDRDAELTRFELASRRLGGLLRRDAAGWLALQTGQAPGKTGIVRVARREHRSPVRTHRRAGWS